MHTQTTLRRRLQLTALGLAGTLIVSAGVVRVAANGPGQARLQADPETFVGKAGDCGTGYAAGSAIVTARWLDGMGLPDNGGANVNGVDPTDNPNKKDDHEGLLLSKNGPTPDCSSAGATIKHVDHLLVTAGLQLGFDVRNGGHCGAGAPRFNVVTSDSVFHFVGGCANGTSSPAPQDPVGWTRVRIDVTSASQAFPALIPGTYIKSIEIVYDEGTDVGPGGGLVVLDNIYVAGHTIRGGDEGHHDDGHHDEWHHKF
jgi:hypothetical protein